MNGDSEQDLQRAEWWLDCAKREKGGMGGGLAHTADSGIASALPPRSGTEEWQQPGDKHRTLEDSKRTAARGAAGFAPTFREMSAGWA